MKVIYKYPILIRDKQIIEMPESAQILTVQVMENKPYIWAMVTPALNKEPIGIRMFATGEKMPPDYTGQYIGSIQVYGDEIYHFFNEGVI